MSERRQPKPNSRLQGYQWDNAYLRRGIMSTSGSNPSPAPEGSGDIEQQPEEVKEFIARGNPLIRVGNALIKRAGIKQDNPRYTETVDGITNLLMDLELCDDSTVVDHADIHNLIAELQVVENKLTQLFSSTPAVAVAPPPTQQPQQTFPPRNIYHFPSFNGAREHYHPWSSQFEQYVESEHPPEEAILRFLKIELTPNLPSEYHSQVQFSQSSGEFLSALDRIYGNAMAALEAVREKIANLPDFSQNKSPDQLLRFFDQLFVINADLHYLDKTFPDTLQLPSHNILCVCNMKTIRAKLNGEVNDLLINQIVRYGRFCPAVAEFKMLLDLADDAKSKAHYLKANNGVSGNQHQNKKDITQIKSTKSHKNRRSPSPRRRSPSPQRNSTSRSPSPPKSSSTQQSSRICQRKFACSFCGDSEHGTFDPNCPLSRGRDKTLITKLQKKRICLRCVLPLHVCERAPDRCDGTHFIAGADTVIKTDCEECSVAGKPINWAICGHIKKASSPKQDL